LYKNEIKEIPEEIGNLLNLKYFYIYCNSLTSLPKTIGNLINLNYLDVKENKIKEIPEEIEHLNNLTQLNISNNSLTKLPNTIKNMYYTNIKYDNNNDIELPPHIIRSIQQYGYFNRIKKPNRDMLLYGLQNCNIIENNNLKSIEYILWYKPIYKKEQLNNLILTNDLISNKTKKILFKYINTDEVYLKYNVTFSELLLYVLNFIDQSNAKNEIYDILEKEMNKNICELFICRINLLAKCLNNYDDNININTTEIEKIGNIILTLKEKLIEDYNLLVEEDKTTQIDYIDDDEMLSINDELLKKELYKNGFTDNIVEEWFYYIVTPQSCKYPIY
jgi:Leucine-rich repeat (LRR) protein